jgi:hypothetical protein
MPKRLRILFSTEFTDNHWPPYTPWAQTSVHGAVHPHPYGDVRPRGSLVWQQRSRPSSFCEALCAIRTRARFRHHAARQTWGSMRGTISRNHARFRSVLETFALLGATARYEHTAYSQALAVHHTTAKRSILLRVLPVNN